MHIYKFVSTLELIPALAPKSFTFHACKILSSVWTSTLYSRERSVFNSRAAAEMVIEAGEIHPSTYGGAYAFPPQGCPFGSEFS